MPDRCEACPLNGTATACPDPAYYCSRVARERSRTPHLRFWSDAVLRAAGLEPQPQPPPAPIEPPGLATMAGNLAKSLAGHVADGGRKASPQVQAERKAACFACDEFHDHARDRCRKCGCTAMNTKRSWASSVCPDTPPRWTAV